MNSLREKLVKHIASIAEIRRDFEELKRKNEINCETRFEKYLKDLGVLAEDIWATECVKTDG